MSEEEVVKLLQNLGSIVECPKCGERGKVAVDRFKSRGHVYYYLVVRHPRGRGRVKRCIIKRLTGDEVAKLDAKREAKSSQVSKQGLEAWSRDEVAKLRKRLEELERENEELRGRLERLQMLDGWVRAARLNGIEVDRTQLEAVKMFYVKRRGYTREQKEAAKHVMTELLERGLKAGHATIIFEKFPSL